MLTRVLGISAAGFVLVAPLLVQQMRLHGGGTPVEIEAAAPRVIRDTVLASGGLIFQQEAQLTPEVIGRVTALLVKEGDEVAEGQVVLRIDDEIYRDTIAQQDAAEHIQSENINRQRLNLEDQQSQLQRAQLLLEKGFMPKANFESLLFAVKKADSDLQSSLHSAEQARAALRLAREQMAKTVIRAPMSGTVVSVSIKLGETAVPSAMGIPGSTLITIAKKSTIMVDLNVDESDVSLLQTGQPARVYCPPFPDSSLRGSIESVALAPRRNTNSALPMGDNGGARSYSVKVKLHDDRSERLRPGMTCRAEIFTSDPPPELAVPIQAVLSDHADDSDGASISQNGPSQHYVFVVENGVARKQLVSLGNADNRYQRILRGVAAGQQVITGPYRSLKGLASGDRVAVQQIPPPEQKLAESAQP